MKATSSDTSTELTMSTIPNLQVVIPSWARLSPQMQAETGVTYPAFIHLQGQPLWVHILQSYAKYKASATFSIVLQDNAPQIDTSLVDGFDIKVIRLAQSRNIGESVFAGLEQSQDTKTARQGLIVHMADTLISELPYTNIANMDDSIYTQKRSDLYRWTSITNDDSGRIIVQGDRVNQIADAMSNVCVGVFALTDKQRFRQILQQVLTAEDINADNANNADNSTDGLSNHSTDSLSANLSDSLPENKMDAFFVAIEHYSQTVPMQLAEVDHWRDFGHVDSYYEARLNFHNLRHFNELTYDADNGVVTKRSQSTQAFRHQVRWFKQIPDEMAYFLPKIYEINDGEEPFISMEFLSIPTLNELFVNERLEVGGWNNVAKKIAHIMHIAQKYEFEASLANNVAVEMYVNKTKNRLTSFIDNDESALSFWVDIDGHRFGLTEVLQSLEAYCQKYNLLTLDKLTPIHGDLCFSNILYDVRSRQVKLIDPRGEFAVPGIYGDARYDKAKMRHSYSGCYDFIVSDRFHYQIDADNKLTCDIKVSDYHHKIKLIMDSLIFDNKTQKIESEAIEALLFLSMLPLHKDKPHRQKAMLFIGLQKYGRLWL